MWSERKLRTDDDARGSHLSIPGIRIFRMNGLHRCVNNNANRFHWCVRADSKPPVSDVVVCDRWIRCRLHRQRSISARRKRRSMVTVFRFLLFLERLAIVNLLVWIGSWGYVCLRLSQLRNFKELKSKVRKLLSKVVVFEKKLKFTFSIFNNRFDRMIQDLFLFE